jgi:hypothetical protein
MTRSTITDGILAAVVVLVTIGAFVRNSARQPSVEPVPEQAATEVQPGFIYGRITDGDGVVYEGRLRWGGTQEAFWDDAFDGAKHENPWATHVEQTPRSFEIFGIGIGGGDRPNFGRPFMTRFGDIARIDARFRTVQVTLKSGATFELDRFSAGDIDDGVRVWDSRRGVVNLDTSDIRTIEFLPTPPLAPAPNRLHGTVHTQHGDFTGFIQWNRRDYLGADALDGRTADGKPAAVRYDTIRSIARRSRDAAVVTLVDGREIALSGGPDVGRNNRIYVDDSRRGRVLISWEAFERADVQAGGSGPAYGDFPPGGPLTGTVITRNGRRVIGRLVYDLDESDTTETLDAPSAGVDYSIPFRLISSIVLPGGEDPDTRHATVLLHDGDTLQLELSGDLAPGNTGVLIFVDGRERPEHVAWADIAQVDLAPRRQR